MEVDCVKYVECQAVFRLRPKISDQLEYAKWLQQTQVACPAILSCRDSALLAIKDGPAEWRRLAIDSFCYIWWSDSESVTALADVGASDIDITLRAYAATALRCLFIRAFRSDAREFLASVLLDIQQANSDVPEIRDDILSLLSCWEEP